MRMESPLAAWCIDEQPYYQPAGREVELFEAACLRRMHSSSVILIRAQFFKNKLRIRIQ